MARNSQGRDEHMQVALREYVEALFEERARASEVAEREREKAAVLVADSLRQHIDGQIGQIMLLLAERERLSLAREGTQDSTVTALDARMGILLAERKFQLDDFKETVQERFHAQNELRGSLDDLSKSMATRRELETTIEAVKVESAVARGGIAKQIEDLFTLSSDLRSRIDTGPPDLHTLQARSDQNIGERQGHERAQAQDRHDAALQRDEFRFKATIAAARAGAVAAAVTAIFFIIHG